MTEHLATTLDQGVLTIRIRRPEKKNALTAPMYTAMTAALRAAETDAAIRVVVFHGEGGSYTAGNDLKDFLARPAGAGPGEASTFIRALAAATVPFVAAVDGVAVGIGTTMLLHCDFVYATPASSFTLPFINLGVVPEAGSSLLLRRLVGYPKAAELLMLGESFDAATAERIGLITAICPPDDLLARATQTARKLAAKPRAALRATKALMKRADEPTIARIARENDYFFALLASPAARELMSAILEKRAPDTAKIRD